MQVLTVTKKLNFLDIIYYVLEI